MLSTRACIFTPGNIFLVLELREHGRRDVATIVAVPRSTIHRPSFSERENCDMLQRKHDAAFAFRRSLSSRFPLPFFPAHDSLRPEGMKIPRTSPVRRQCVSWRERQSVRDSGHPSLLHSPLLSSGHEFVQSESLIP